MDTTWKTVHIATVEDEESSYQTIVNSLNQYGEKYNVHFQTARFLRGEDFLSSYRPIYDIVFLDIMLPGINGIDTAKKLREIDENVTLIFITNLANFAVKGYEVSALDFIVKPIVYASFEVKLKRAIQVAYHSEEEKVTIYSEGSTVILYASDIYYIEVVNHNLYYHTLKGEIHGKGSLTPLEEKLKKFNFSRCNSAYLVNLKYVSAIHGEDIDVNGITLRIGRSKRTSFLKDLANYLGKSL